MPWVEMSDANLRRCAVEATRPRGVWCAHIAALKENPAVAMALLDAVRADESLYVRKSVGNWLNDASKTRPDWVKTVCKRWTKGKAHPHTLWIVKHGSRSLP
jgi:3-methyladenine DNA glycosylase AlkC